MTLKFENPGYVYIMSNEALTGLKIGYTQRSPYARAEELFSTGVPKPFVVEHFFFVEDAPLCEELVHTRLNRFRIDEGREFFRVDLPRAIRTIEQAIDDLREKLWSKEELSVFKNYKNNNENNVKEVPLVNQSPYNNPKFKEMIKVLKESRGLQTSEEIAKKIKVSTEGAEKIIRMMEGIQGSSILYKREENRVKKYAVALSFNVQQLTILAEKFPALNLMELKPLFDKQKNKYPNNKTYNGNKNNKQNSGNNNQQAKTVTEFIQNKVNENHTSNVVKDNDPLSKHNLMKELRNSQTPARTRQPNKP